MNYSFDNSAISCSHPTFGDFDVDILQNPAHSFCHPGCQLSPRRRRRSWARHPQQPRCPGCHAHSCGMSGSQTCRVTDPLSQHALPLLLSVSFVTPRPRLCLCVSPPRALPGMMQWIRSQRPGESGINIITADFVELGEFISAVITLNYHLDDDEDDAT